VRSLETVFRRSRAQGRLALIGYLPAGFPDVDRYPQLVRAAVEEGLDVLEIGLPVDAPILEGRLIRLALARIAASGISLDRALELGAEAVGPLDVAAVAMVYASVLVDYGTGRMLKRCRQLRIAGVLLVGAPPAEWIRFSEAARHAGLRPIGFLSADLGGRVLPRIVAGTGGFVYVPSYDGKTGQRHGFDERFTAHLGRVQACARRYDLPVAVGFGVHTPGDVRRLAAMGVDGVIVGTALVRAAAKGPAEVRRLVGSLARAASLEVRPARQAGG
jgi:tryptophan synthase alpha chain